MKKIILSIASLIALSIVTSSCKKGDGDAFLSLRSRKARVVGEWKATKFEEKNSSSTTSVSGGITTTSSSTGEIKLEGDKFTVVMTETDENGDVTTINASGTGTLTLKFEKDGTFSNTRNFSGSGTIASQGGSANLTMTSDGSSSGTWTFLTGVEKDFKNKERLLLNNLTDKETNNSTITIPLFGTMTTTESSDNTYLAGESTETWLIGTLKNKLFEATMSGKSVEKSTTTTTFGGTPTTSSNTTNSEFTRTSSFEQ
jgi:hypothetical protein